jgi:hypothetical protein
MPNWTHNFMRVEGDEKDIRAFLDAIKWQDELFDFNRIIPMPELLKNTGSGFMKIDGEKVNSWYIEQRNPGGNDKVRRFTREEKEELARIGAENWYDWSIENWGTKWNPCHLDISGAAINGSLEVTFDTAWSAPVPIFRKIVVMFPKLSFAFQWCDEGDDYAYSLDDCV